MLLPDVNVLVAAHREAAPRHPSTTWVNPGRQHLGLLEEACRRADARGDLVSDAAIAALALEAGATVITYDRDSARFPSVRWRTPA